MSTNTSIGSSTSASFTAPPGVTAEALDIARLEQVQNQLPRFIVITFLCVLVTTWLLWDWPLASNRNIAIWAITFSVFLLIRLVVVWWLSMLRRPSLRLISGALMLTAFITGLFWSSAGIVLNPRIFPSGELLAEVTSRQALLSAMIGAQGISALSAYVGHFRSFLLFTTAIYLPSLIYLLLHPTSTSYLVFVIGVFWWIFLIISARYLNRMVLGALELRFNNEHLINFLRQAQSRSLAMNNRLTGEVRTRTLAETKLQQLNDELESRVRQRTLALQESQESLTLAIEASGTALWDWNLKDGTLNHTNLMPILGCEGLATRSVRAEARRLIHPDDIRQVTHDMISHLRRITPAYESRYRIKHQNGQWVWVEDKGRVVAWQANGKPLRILGIRRDISAEHKAMEAQRKLDYLANYDRLTQLANRRQFRNRLHAAITVAREANKELGIIYLNLDRFRQINETLGFEVGDSILRETGRRLTEIGTEFDTIARLSGDEFAIIYTELRDITDLDRICEEIIGTLRMPFKTGDHELLLGASLGVSVFPDHGRELVILINHADLAMQQAKRLGGNQYRFYNSDMRSATVEQLNLENSLRKAIFRDEFIVHYQPKVALSSKRIVGMEALVRWQHPTLGLLQPGRFIPLAEETGLIAVITERVLQQATRQVKAWADQGLGALTVAVNIPPQQLRKGNLLHTLKEALDASGLPANQLELELTESSLMDDPDLAIKILSEARARGMLIALDDFGTGYSSLSYLRRFPLDTLKIDQTFVKDLGKSEEDGAIVRAIITMAHQLGMTVTAEGIETACHLDFLIRERCDYVQGYYISRPITAEAMTELLLQQKDL
ncbi:MAG: EAL domain-containing protein [Moraxellaceae bacterium]|nr:EAL domain-containing protein [Moraxellaceae bacterium]MDZ4386408.1 EAL domain-containing protein [Moraxellaceae bacterium]